MNSLFKEEIDAIKCIEDSGSVDMMPPNQLGIPIAAEEKIGYLSSAIKHLNKAIHKLKKIRKDFSPYGLYSNNNNNNNNNNNENMEGGKRKTKQKNKLIRHKTRKYRK
jgi:hypothetical protein